MQLKALLAVVGQVLGQQRQQAGFLLSRRVQMTDPAFASADTTACANVFIIACNTSGDAPATCSHSRSTGVHISDVAIAHHSPSPDLAVSKDRAVAVSYLRNTPITGKSYTTSLDVTLVARR
ncbi:hypothetical protein ACLQ2S_13340 [Micromonospora sp. DT48]|uniref:hypothetical protein n=1 Tax=unclassified Micromonospora TaxID=2617518 RepID=UPI0018AD1155|nr:hypothetical protein [Micromonospora sp. CP22]